MPSPSPPKLDAAMLWNVLLAGYWLALVVATHLPKRIASLPSNQTDKFVHVAAFAVLAWLLATAWQSSVGRLNGRHLWFVWLTVVLYAVADELTQLLVGRTASIADWLADAVGAALGISIFRIWHRRVD